MSRAALAVLAFLPALACAAAGEWLLPAPAAIVPASGSLRVTSATPLVVEAGDVAARRVAINLAGMLARSHGVRLVVRTDRAPNAIRFLRLREGVPESYRIEVRADGASLSASSDAGLAHAATSLWQLAARAPRGAVLPALTLEDAPRLAWRGVVLDSERRFHPPAFVRRLVDWMGARKLNVLHWRLAGPGAWRLEIRSRPRPPRPAGWYSQDTVRAIVAYAAERGISVVPRFDSAQPLGDEGLREILALFPSRYIDYAQAQPRLAREGRVPPDAAVIHTLRPGIAIEDAYAAPLGANVTGIEAAVGEGRPAQPGRPRFPLAEVAAEVGWSGPAAREWRDFVRRAEALAAR